MQARSTGLADRSLIQPKWENDLGGHIPRLEHILTPTDLESMNVSSHRHNLPHPFGFVRLGLKITISHIQWE
jgi:hypothetical protein